MRMGMCAAEHGAFGVWRWLVVVAVGGWVEAAEKVVFIYTRTGSLLKVRYAGAALEGMVSLFIKRWSWRTGLDWCSHWRLTNKERLSMIYGNRVVRKQKSRCQGGNASGTEQSVQGI